MIAWLLGHAWEFGWRLAVTIAALVTVWNLISPQYRLSVEELCAVSVCLIVVTRIWARYGGPMLLVAMLGISTQACAYGVGFPPAADDAGADAAPKAAVTQSFPDWVDPITHPPPVSTVPLLIGDKPPAR